MADKPLLVGVNNPYGPDEDFALYPSPPNCAGHRLCHKVMGLSETDYLARFDRTNLCGHEWDLAKARVRADAIRAERKGPIVLLGSSVAKAFRLSYQPFTRNGRFVILPHPSGLCRLWHEGNAYERARAVLREAGVL